MKVKAIGKTHMLLILTAAEAQYLGIPTESGCAMILRTHTAFFPYTFCESKRYRIRTAPQVFHLNSCAAMLNLIERLCQLQIDLPCLLFASENGYDLVFHPTCRQFFLLRSLAGEYGTLRGKSPKAVAYLREYGRLLSKNALHDVGQHLRQAQR